MGLTQLLSQPISKIINYPNVCMITIFESNDKDLWAANLAIDALAFSLAGESGERGGGMERHCARHQRHFPVRTGM